MLRCSVKLAPTLASNVPPCQMQQTKKLRGGDVFAIPVTLRYLSRARLCHRYIVFSSNQRRFSVCRKAAGDGPGDSRAAVNGEGCAYLHSYFYGEESLHATIPDTSSPAADRSALPDSTGSRDRRLLCPDSEDALSRVRYKTPDFSTVLMPNPCDDHVHVNYGLARMETLLSARAAPQRLFPGPWSGVCYGSQLNVLTAGEGSCFRHKSLLLAAIRMQKI